MYGYRTIEKAISKLMDGGDPNSFSHVLYRPPTFSSNVGDILHRLAISYAQVQNRSGGTTPVGVGARLHKSRWKAGQWTDSSTTFTDDTVDAQDASGTDFPLETLTANDGFLVAALDLFSVICLNIVTASVGGTPVRTLEYSQAGGTWAAITNALVMPVTSGHYAAGEVLVWFTPPADWAPLEAGHGTGVPIGLYAVRVRATTAPSTTAGVAHGMSLALAVGAVEGVADNVIYSSPYGRGEHTFDCMADALVGIIGTANAQNVFNVNVRCV